MSVARAEAEIAEALVAELHAAMRLAPDTQKRLTELFAGKVCDRCGGQAVRLVGKRFYCASHYLRRSPREAREPRVYRCSAA